MAYVQKPASIPKIREELLEELRQTNALIENAKKDAETNTEKDIMLREL